MNELDLIEGVRLLCGAVEQLAEDSVRRSGSVESQRAGQLVARAQHTLDLIASQAIAKGS